MKICVLCFPIIAIIGCSLQSSSSVEQPEYKDILFKKKIILNGSTVHIVDTLQQLNRKFQDCNSNRKSYILISMYIASCSPCLIKMKRWKQLIATEPIFNGDLEFIFYAKNKITWYFDYQVNEVNDFPFKIYHDPDDVFARANNLPELAYVNSVLLDSMNRIVYSGNPMDNEEDFQELKCYLLNEN